MDKKNVISLLSDVLFVVMVILFGTLSLVFVLLYAETYFADFYAKFGSVVIILALIIVAVNSVLSLTFLRSNKRFLAKIILFLSTIICVISVGAYLLKSSGFTDKVNDVESLREYVSGFGRFASIQFIVIQFLQVVILPIPSFITIAAGVLLFGSLKCAVLSSIGIIVGSIVSFYLGKTLGYSTLSKFFGKKKIDGLLDKLHGKDKVMLTAMFLLPFFPDDVLCFVAGITTIEPSFFIVMIFIARIITVFSAAYSLNNQLIPYDTWWGIAIWIALFIIVVIICIIVYKHGDKLEKLFKKNNSK